VRPGASWNREARISQSKSWSECDQLSGSTNGVLRRTKPGIDKVATLTIAVRDQDEALQWFTEKLDFEKRADVSAPGNALADGRAEATKGSGVCPGLVVYGLDWVRMLRAFWKLITAKERIGHLRAVV